MAGTSYQTNGVAWSVAYANGVVYVGGTFTKVRPSGSAAGANESARTNLAAFDASTGSLLPCAPAITIGSGTATVRALTPSADGKTLYVGGNFSSIGGTARSSLAALDTASCTVVATFKPAVAATVRAIALNAGTDVYFAGDFKSVSGQTRNLAAAVTPAGALTAWNPNLVAPAGGTIYTSMRALTVLGDNSGVVLGGDFDYVNGTYVHRLAVVDPATGALTKNFGDFVDNTSSVKALTHDADNFYLGAEGTGGGVFDGRAAFRNDGTLVWRDNCLGATQALYAAGSVLYSGSHAHDCSNTPGGYSDGARHHLLAQSIQDSTLQPWFPNTNDGIGEQIGPRGLTMSPDGALWVVGEFTTVNGVAQQGITRFGPKPVNSVPSAPVPTLASYNPGKISVRWKTVADNDTGTLTYRLYRDNVLINTQSADSRFFDRPQLSFVDTVTDSKSHVYRLDVSDGTFTSPIGGTAGLVATTATSTYYNAIQADSPKYYWRLDDGSQFAADSAGTNPGILPSGMSYKVPGAPQTGGTAAAFAGTDSLQANNVEIGPSNYTSELWFKTTTTSGGELVGFGNNSRTNAGSGNSNNYDRHIYMLNSGQLTLGEYAGYTSTVTSAKAYNDGNWHHVAGTLGATGQRLYVDGKLVGSNTNTAAQSYSGEWRIAGGNLNGWPNQPSTNNFTGTVDDVAIYSTALPAAKIYEHYFGQPEPTPTTYDQAVQADAPVAYWRFGEAAGPTADDATGQGNTATYGSGVTLGQAGAVPGSTDTAATLNGGSATAATWSAANPQSFSTELWFKTGTLTGGELLSFGNDQNGASSNYDRNLYLSDNGRLTFGLYNGGFHLIQTVAAYNNNTWHHVVATVGTDGMVLYVDGAVVGTNAQTSAQGYDGYWKVGGDNLNSWPDQPTTTQVTGSIDEVAIYGSALTAADVTKHYSFAH
ncbi:MAG: LamG-like jellyroll fold domain-containing protein [Pseudonocardiales bacterium]